MAFQSYGDMTKFARDEHVDIHVRRVTLDAEGPKPLECVEIREFIREGDLYGHGLVLPEAQIKDLASAFDLLGLLARPSVGAR